MFENFVGNNRIKSQISGSINSSNLPHVILLEGEDGLGKKTFANEIANVLVCRAPLNERPCGKCSQCIKAQKHIHPDINEYCASKSETLKIETVRYIIRDAYIAPNEAEYKIYILEDIHYMNENAQNAILKILEEPPDYVIFIMTVRNKSMLLPTIISRAVSYSCLPVEPHEAAKYISQQYPSISYDHAFDVVNTQHGNIGHSLDILLNTEGLYPVDIVKETIDALVNGNEYSLLSKINSCVNVEQITAFLKLIEIVFRDALFYGKSSELILPGLKSLSELLFKNFSESRLIKLIESTKELIKTAGGNISFAMFSTEVCAKLFRVVDR